MSDGNTAIPVSPVTEDTMTNVKQVFQHALDAIVSASTLKVEVDELRKSVQDLQTQVDHYRNTIANYDDQVARLRHERDDANSRVWEAENRLTQLTNTHNATLSELEQVRHDHASARERIDVLHKERDEAQFKVLDLQDQLDTVTKKLAEIEDFARKLFPQAPPPVSQAEVGVATSISTVVPVAEPPKQAEGQPWWETKVG